MTDREKLEAWAKDWANNDEIPDHAMDLFLDAAEKAIAYTPGIQSESLGDYSVSVQGDIPSALDSVARSYLRPYRRVSFR